MTIAATDRNIASGMIRALDARYPADIPDVGVSDANVVVDTAAHTLRAVRAVLTSADPQ